MNRRVFQNSLKEIAEKTGKSVDDVVDELTTAATKGWREGVKRGVRKAVRVAIRHAMRAFRKIKSRPRSKMKFEQKEIELEEAKESNLFFQSDSVEPNAIKSTENKAAEQTIEENDQMADEKIISVEDGMIVAKYYRYKEDSKKLVRTLILGAAKIDSPAKDNKISLQALPGLDLLDNVQMSINREDGIASLVYYRLDNQGDAEILDRQFVYGYDLAA